MGKIIHGMYGTDEYKAWHNMIQRCRLDVNYISRGIKVCDRWRNSFADFLADVGMKPHWDLTLDRIDSDKDYEPGNIRWATRIEQNLNKSKKGSSGERWIYAHTNGGWTVNIYGVYIGHFQTIEEAVVTRDEVLKTK